MVPSRAIVRYRAGAVGLAAAGALVVLVVSCRQIVGITDNPPAELTTTACGLPSGTTTCASCASAHCCKESNACAQDPIVCAPYESCLGACDGGAACRSKCTIDDPVPAANAAPVTALSACLAQNCGDACNLKCGGFAGYLTEPDTAAACETCLQQNGACGAGAQCGSSGECDAFWRCYLACVTPDCQTSCVAAYDAGVGTFDPLYQVFKGTCAKACGYGAYWACAGKITAWPAAPSPPTYSWTGWVQDWESQTGVGDARVTVCTNCPCGAPTDPATNSVIAHGQTDDAGYVSLTFQQGVSPTGQGTEYCYQAAAPGYLTSFAYGGFPGTEHGWSARGGLLPPTAWASALFTPQAQQTNDTAVGATYDPTRSMMVTAGVFDCLGSPVPAGSVDVSINVRDPNLFAYLPADAGPDAWPTAQTGAAGASDTVIFFDVPVDAGANITLTATVPGIGIVSQTVAYVAPNTITQVGLVPTPPPNP